MFGSIGKAVGGMFGGQKPPQQRQVFQGQDARLSGAPMGSTGGIGPSIQSAGQMMQKPMMGMKPPSMGQQSGDMGGMNSGMKPPGLPGMYDHGPRLYPGGSATFDESGGGYKNQQPGLGPSMGAMQQMMGQPEQAQQPAAAGPMPNFDFRGGDSPLNRGYGRM